MKKLFIFILGIITGFLLAIIIGLAYNHKENSNVKFFDKPGEIITAKTFEVIQVIDSESALASEKIDKYSTGETVLLYNKGGYAFYDDQIVTVPKGKCFRHVGIFRYQGNYQEKTVRIIAVFDR